MSATTIAHVLGLEIKLICHSFKFLRQQKNSKAAGMNSTEATVAKSAHTKTSGSQMTSCRLAAVPEFSDSHTAEHSKSSSRSMSASPRHSAGARTCYWESECFLKGKILLMCLGQFVNGSAPVQGYVYCT